MTATYSELGSIATQQDFQQRVAIALNTVAVAIYFEGTGVTGHAQRAGYANRVLQGNYSILAVSQAVLTATAIQATAQLNTVENSILDSDIQNQIIAIFNALANA